MKNRIFLKGLISGMLVLFLGTVITPMVGSLSVEKHPSMIDSVKESNTIMEIGLLDVNATLRGTMGENGWYVSWVWPCIHIDNMTGLEYIGYQDSLEFGDYEWHAYTYPRPFVVNGYHSLRILVIDQYNTYWFLGPLLFKIDYIPPTMNLTKEGLDINHVKFIATVSDKTSGVWYVEFYLDNQLMYNDTTSPFEWTRTGYGNHIVTAQVFDTAGNSASSSISTPCVQSQSQSSSSQNQQQSDQQSNPLIQNLILHHQMMSR